MFTKNLFLGSVWALALAASLFVFVSCDDDNGKNVESSADVVQEEAFSGTMTVSFMGSDFKTSDVVIYVQNVKYSNPDKTKGTADLLFSKVKFVPQMPISLDITVPGVTFSVTDGSHARISGEGIIPLTGGKEYEQYKVTGLGGEITNADLKTNADDEITLALKFGEYPVSYSGKYTNPDK